MNILSALIAPVASFFTLRQEIKAKAEAAKASITKAKVDGETQHTLNTDEWEALSKQQENGTWKDEYVTIVVTSPLVLLFIASIWSGFTGDMRFVEAVNLGIANVKNLGIDLGDLMYIVVLAAVGIKGFKSLR